MILWDGIPKSHTNSVVNTANYLTVFDWAVGFSLGIHATNDEERFGSSAVEALHRRRSLVSFWEAAEAVRFLGLFPRRYVTCLPWIRTIDAWGGRAVVSVSSIYCIRSAQKWPVKPLRPDWTVPDASSWLTSHSGRIHASIIRRIWTAALTSTAEPGEHHALANLVGPLALLGDEGRDSHEQALQRLLRQVGVIPPDRALQRHEAEGLDNMDQARCQVQVTR